MIVLQTHASGRALDSGGEKRYEPERRGHTRLNRFQGLYAVSDLRIVCYNYTLVDHVTNMRKFTFDCLKRLARLLDEILPENRMLIIFFSENVNT